MKKATLWFWLGVVLTGVRARYIQVTFPRFKNEARERATYYQGDLLRVAWVASDTIQLVYLYCTRSAELSWPNNQPYGGGESLGASGIPGQEKLGNAQKMNVFLATKQDIGNGTQIYQLTYLTAYDLDETVECAFAAYGTSGPENDMGYGYPFKFHNFVRLNPINTPFGLDGPIDADDISNEPSSTISTQVTSATGISTTGLPQNNPTATESADGPDLTAISTSSGTVLPTGPAPGIEPGTAESPGAKKDRGGLSNGAIAGIAAGAATLGIIMSALAFFVFWRRRRSQLTAAAAAATASASTADSTSPRGGGEEGRGGGGGGGGETQEKGAMTTYSKAELEDNPQPYRNELDGTCKEAEVKEKAQVSELGAVEPRHEVDGGGGGGWNNRFELA